MTALPEWMIEGPTAADYDVPPELDETERKATKCRDGLDPITRTYASADMSTGTLLANDPFDVSIDPDEVL